MAINNIMNTDVHLLSEAYRSIREQAAAPTVPGTPSVPQPSVVQSPQIQQNKLIDDILNRAVVPYNKKVTFLNFLNTLREYNPTTGTMGTPQPQPTNSTQVTQDVDMDKMLDTLIQMLGIPYPNKQRIYSTLMSLRGGA
jgi:hypothetical protein